MRRPPKIGVTFHLDYEFNYQHFSSFSDCGTLTIWMDFLWPNFQMLKLIFSKFMENTPLHRGRNVVTAWFEKKHYDASWSDLLMSSSFAHVNVVPYTYKVSTSQFHTYFSFIASLCTVEIWYVLYVHLKQLLWEVGIFKTEPIFEQVEKLFLSQKLL